METKFCKDCRFAVEEERRYDPELKPRPEYMKCSNPDVNLALKSGEYLVTGEEPEFVHCKVERGAAASGASYPCGREGLLWESKDEPETLPTLQ